MKLQGNRYYCEWCNFKFEQKVGKFISSNDSSKGKKNISSQCICPKCNRYVSQKTRQERENKLSNGQGI